MSPRIAWMGAILGMFLTLPTGLLPAAVAYPAGSVMDAPSVRQPGAAAVSDQPCTVGWGDPDTSFPRSILSSVVSAGSQSWAVGLTFGITLYGLGAVAVLFAMYGFALLGDRRAGWALPIFAGTE